MKKGNVDTVELNMRTETIGIIQIPTPHLSVAPSRLRDIMERMEDDNTL